MFHLKFNLCTLIVTSWMFRSFNCVVISPDNTESKVYKGKLICKGILIVAYYIDKPYYFNNNAP